MFELHPRRTRFRPTMRPLKPSWSGNEIALRRAPRSSPKARQKATEGLDWAASESAAAAAL